MVELSPEMEREEGPLTPGCGREPSMGTGDADKCARVVSWQVWRASQLRIKESPLYRGCSGTGTRSCWRPGLGPGAPAGASGWYPLRGWAAPPHQCQAGWRQANISWGGPRQLSSGGCRDQPHWAQT